jgi:hypothetical protein
MDCTPSLAGAKASACARLEQVKMEKEVCGFEGKVDWKGQVCVLRLC